MGQTSTRRTPSRASVSPGLARVRTAARLDRKERFTALLHHVDAGLLRRAYFWLKRDAGRIDDAKRPLTEMLKLKPEASSIAGCRRLRPWGNARYWELFDETAATGLRRAGFPDG